MSYRPSPLFASEGGAAESASVARMHPDSRDEQRLSNLRLLRRVRDRIDREYAEPLDVEALARGVGGLCRPPQP